MIGQTLCKMCKFTHIYTASTNQAKGRKGCLKTPTAGSDWGKKMPIGMIKEDVKGN